MCRRETDRQTDRQTERQTGGVSHETLFILSGNATYNLTVLLKCCFSMHSVVGSSSPDQLESVMKMIISYLKEL